MIRLQFYCSAIVVHELHEPLRIAEFLVPERHNRALWASVDLRDTSAAAVVLDLARRQKVFHFDRHGSEAVGKFRGKVLKVGAFMKPRKSAVKAKPHLQIRHI